MKIQLSKKAGLMDRLSYWRNKRMREAQEHAGFYFDMTFKILMVSNEVFDIVSQDNSDFMTFDTRTFADSNTVTMHDMVSQLLMYNDSTLSGFNTIKFCVPEEEPGLEVLVNHLRERVSDDMESCAHIVLREGVDGRFGDKDFADYIKVTGIAASKIYFQVNDITDEPSDVIVRRAIENRSGYGDAAIFPIIDVYTDAADIVSPTERSIASSIIHRRLDKIAATASGGYPADYLPSELNYLEHVKSTLFPADSGEVFPITDASLAWAIKTLLVAGNGEYDNANEVKRDIPMEYIGDKY